MLPLLSLLSTVAAQPGLVELAVDARVTRNGVETQAVVGTRIRNGDTVLFRVTSGQGGYLSLLNYAPSGVVMTHCPPEQRPCASERVEAGTPHEIGPFLVQRDAGWEIFDLVLTRRSVDPNDLLRFGYTPRTKSLGGGSVIGFHPVTETRLHNLPDVLQGWLTFALYHEE